MPKTACCAEFRSGEPSRFLPLPAIRAGRPGLGTDDGFECGTAGFVVRVRG